MSPLIGAIPAAPTRDEMRAALDVFVRAWAPYTAPPAEPVDEQDDGCDCGGEDDDGTPYCNCAGNCICPRCVHYWHARARVCSVGGCYQRTRYRVVPWCVHRDGTYRAASDGDPATGDNGYVHLGDSVQRQTPRYACTTQHAAEIVATDRRERIGFDADSLLSAPNTYYDIDRWDYEPDDIDVPGALHPLLADLESAARFTRRAIAAAAGIGPAGSSQIIGCGIAVTAAIGHLIDYANEQDAEAAQTAAAAAVDDLKRRR